MSKRIVRPKRKAVAPFNAVMKAAAATIIAAIFIHVWKAFGQEKIYIKSDSLQGATNTKLELF